MGRKIQETAEQKVDRWIAGASKSTWEQSQQIMETWEAGQVGYVTAYGANFERYDLPEGGYVVIEWSEECGLICIV